MSKRGVQFVQQDEPAFLKRFKQECGYKEEPTVDTKKVTLPEDNDSGEEKEDEKPQVVVLKKGDLSEEDVNRFLQENNGDVTPTLDDENEITGTDDCNEIGKIRFKKPVKNKVEDVNTASTKKKADPGAAEKSTKITVTAPTTLSKSLLSFNDDDGDD